MGGKLSQTYGRLASVVHGFRESPAAGSAADESRRERTPAVSDPNVTELFGKIEDALLLYDTETLEVVQANDVVEDVWGYDSGAILGKTAAELSATLPDLDQEIEGYMAGLLAGEPRQFDWLLERADGTTVWANVSANLTTFGEEEYVMALVRDVSERKQREEAIQELHDATREMVRASDKTEVARITVEAAESILELPLVGVWCLDETERVLEPTAASSQADELLGTHPTFERGDGLAWDVFQSQKPAIYDDVSTVDGVYNETTPVRSEMLVPCGRNGLLIAGSTTTAEFTETDLSLAQLLAANAQVAIDRTAYINQLTRRTSQMEFFNGLIRHDVMNAMMVIGSRAEILSATLDGEQRRHALTIAEWTDDAAEVVRHVRDILSTFTDEDGPDLEPKNVSASLRAEVGRLRTTYPAATFEVDAEANVVVTANDLLDDVLGNLVGNAVEHNDTADLTVEVSVWSDPDTGRAHVEVADDGMGVPDDRKEAIFRRGETGLVKHTGSGFGLFFVDVMVSSYAGSITVRDNDPSGAVFELTLPLAGTDRPSTEPVSRRIVD
ncbi:ATP-binding protein [Haloarculaceae archaeon H-GB11]|nr:ATP-binding protein [Haloarculaceae archaeon H-GB11]